MAKCNNLFKIKLGPEIMKEQYIFYALYNEQGQVILDNE